MATKYRKIDPRIWRDERFARLSASDKLIALYCLTAQSNRCGIFVFSPAMAAEEIGTLPQTFREGFRNVCAALRWRWDEERRVLYFPTWWKYNPPENANVLAGNLKDMDDLPETPLLIEFYDNLRYLPGGLGGTFRERCPKPSPIQEQEQEQEQEQDLPPTEVCSEPPVPAISEPVLLTFPVTGKQREWHLTESKASEYRQTYPGLDVLGALRSARQWCVDNATKRKTHRGMPAFCARWLERSVNHGQHRTTGPPGTVPFRGAGGKRTVADVIAESRANREAAEAMSRTEGVGT